MAEGQQQWARSIPLISAEGEMRITTMTNMGRYCDIVVEFGNRILSGNVSGFLFRVRLPWKRALQWADALVVGGDSVKAQLMDGRAAVLGQRYGPILMELNPMAQFYLYLTPEDCETLAHVVTEAVIVGTGRNITRKPSWQGI